MSQVFLGMPSIQAQGQAHTGGWVTNVSTPQDALRWGHTFPEGAHRALANTQMRRNLGHATRTIRAKRGQRVEEMPDWEQLREAAEAVKFEVASRLPELLEQFEANVTAHGGIVHWARDAAEANRIIASILKAKGCDDVVKVKSMATQETNLNEYLKDEGITAHETDLAELIVQLADDMPSHIVVPAIHRNRAEVRGIFLDRMEDAPADLSDNPEELAGAARAHLRKKFLHSTVAISGTNMGVAETGTVSVFESEGNGRMCLTLPDTLITLMGIEKLVPRYQDIEIFSQLLPRSATGERMNPYTSMWTGVTPGDGPQEFHLILMDNGRTKTLTDPIGRQALACIRCGSCMNICPVYQHTGGHAYGSVYPGPIGAIITPQLTQGLADDDPVHTLPYASSLCGACADVCPVKIDIPTILIHLRARSVDVKRRAVPDMWDLGMAATTPVMSNPALWKSAPYAVKASRLLGGKDAAIGALPFPASLWTRTRDIPVAPRESLRQWWKRTHPDGVTPPETVAAARAALEADSATKEAK
ncbi:MAG: LutB/LldF family L-lactate oxidation iron-sulfur protein [Actinomyces urogenitalis]|uniref:Iron-sulfur cluster-binding protein n=1 Tax=Actinomyces urogenitalis TaxID=103621 RepID=A0A2I1KST8_9ACTO|nr:LutB/LldF family L-lactate oxidation iron-sulfur protein [Actinomyces urogenitalis]MBS5978007.1 iron-sulfur cluster-binding protein [Actinomyces urogenitalis]MDK8237946.1 LutB/LldF family L-lactate oxidation iron-sulfur protein [Actinomyces urogenitalis]MDU0972079.1 LutB/LldF family L-lactate oxidation iron-sulfur protein [Actinomyces urogenitalis]PKY98680.1 iron-sulfur cluster-binding protein [Actinomyces urogenitalis]WOO95379.1 LutB/LldF family L-lactate oxidation iron-sulfur protein [Act